MTESEEEQKSLFTRMKEESENLLYNVSTVIKTISKKKNARRQSDWLSEEGLQRAEKIRETKGKGEKEIYFHLNAEFQRMLKKDKKAFLSNQCKEIEENNRMRKTSNLLKKIRDIKGTFHAKMGTIKDRKGERNSRVVPPFPESPRCLSPFQGNLFSLHCLDFQAEARLTPRWHVGQPCEKASWESPVGKPRGKATDPLIHGKESSTLLLQLGRKAHVHAPTRDED